MFDGPAEGGPRCLALPGYAARSPRSHVEKEPSGRSAASSGVSAPSAGHDSSTTVVSPTGTTGKVPLSGGLCASSCAKGRSWLTSLDIRQRRGACACTRRRRALAIRIWRRHADFVKMRTMAVYPTLLERLTCPDWQDARAPGRGGHRAEGRHMSPRLSRQGRHPGHADRRGEGRQRAGRPGSGCL